MRYPNDVLSPRPLTEALSDAGRLVLDGRAAVVHDQEHKSFAINLIESSYVVCRPWFAYGGQYHYWFGGCEVGC